MRFVVLAGSERTELRARSLDNALARTCGGYGSSESLTVRRSTTSGACVRAWARRSAYPGSPQSGAFRALLATECARRGYEPAEFLVGAPMRGVVLVALALGSGEDSSLSVKRYDALADASNACGWLDALPYARAAQPAAKRRRAVTAIKPD